MKSTIKDPNLIPSYANFLLRVLSESNLYFDHFPILLLSANQTVPKKDHHNFHFKTNAKPPCNILVEEAKPLRIIVNYIKKNERGSRCI